MSKRKASSIWQGGLQNGSGRISTESGALKDTAYSFRTRFESDPGTNPEELIAAAHASCFSMALSHELEKAGLGPGRIETTATVTLAKEEEGWSITAIKLETVGTVASDEASFLRAAQTAKENCPISRLLNAPIELDARLSGGEEAVMAS